MGISICAVEGCDKPKRKRQWCDRHYQAWYRHGDPTVAKFEWSARAETCIVCGKPEIAQRRRRFCSSACQVAHSRARRAARNKSGTLTRPATNCVRCGIPLLVGRANGRSIHKSTRRFCDECKATRTRDTRLAVMILAHYRGTECGICGEPIDLQIRFPDKQCASIDHVVPLALGGTDDPTNLRLAHYACNCRREDYFRMTAEEIS